MKVHYYELWSTFFQNLCSFWLRSVRDDAVSSEDFANTSVCRGHWQTAHNGSPIDSRPHFFSLFNSPGNESDVGDVSQTKSERVFAACLAHPLILSQAKHVEKATGGMQTTTQPMFKSTCKQIHGGKRSSECVELLHLPDYKSKAKGV